ncbi:MAG: hypothetical protein FWE87_05890, partial [Coriobacteriia bacterium]|nr:hypothetical protein [Coriobacteriia bacterium]
ETTRTPGIDPVVFTGGIRIYKHDAVNENVALEGATFMLVPKTEDDFDDEPVKTSTIIATSGADGVVEFKGIAYGRPLRVDELAELATLGSEYWLVETAAPAGYRTPGGGWQVVTINISSWNALAEPLALTKVPNVKGFNFPMTGGMGTLAFILAGSALAAAAYGSHKMGRKERELA